jgi:hypothetical protein
MWTRWRPILLMAAGFFAITVIARLLSRFVADNNDKVETRIGYVAFGAVAVLAAALAVYWGRRHPASQVILDLGGAILIACLLSVLIGPFISGDKPFASGAGSFFAQIWAYCGVGFGGGLLGLLGLIALGLDHRSQALKRYAQVRGARANKLSRPNRAR